MNRLAKLFRFFPLIALLLAAACGGSAPASPTADAAAIYTAAYETAQTQSALTAMAPTNTPFSTLTLAGTSTISGPTKTPLITDTPLVTNTPVPLIPRTPQAQCDDSIFFADITIPDGTVVLPGEKFVKTWQVKNTGLCSWDQGYGAVYSYGDQMGGLKFIPISEALVNPGDYLNIDVKLTAPLTPGKYEGCWIMQNDTGTYFGRLFCVRITVSK